MRVRIPLFSIIIILGLTKIINISNRFIRSAYLNAFSHDVYLISV